MGTPVNKKEERSEAKWNALQDSIQWNLDSVEIAEFAHTRGRLMITRDLLFCLAGIAEPAMQE